MGAHRVQLTGVRTYARGWQTRTELGGFPTTYQPVVFQHPLSLQSVVPTFSLRLPA
jgi:hypothetical protein